MAKSNKCKKSSNRKDRNLAEATTRANKIRKCETILRNHPNNHVVANQLAQLRHDSGVK